MQTCQSTVSCLTQGEKAHLQVKVPGVQKAMKRHSSQCGRAEPAHSFTTASPCSAFLHISWDNAQASWQMDPLQSSIFILESFAPGDVLGNTRSAADAPGFPWILFVWFSPVPWAPRLPPEIGLRLSITSTLTFLPFCLNRLQVALCTAYLLSSATAPLTPWILISVSREIRGDFPCSSYFQFIQFWDISQVYLPSCAISTHEEAPRGRSQLPISWTALPQQLPKVSTQWLKGRRGANSICFVWHRGLRKSERQIIQNKKRCKNRLENYCAVTINEAIENINHSPASEACCERRIRRFYVPSTRKPQGPGA